MWRPPYGASNKGKHKKAGPRFLHGPAWLGIFSLSGDRGLGGLGHKLAIRTVYAIPRDHFRSKGKVHRSPAAGLTPSNRNDLPEADV